MRIPMHAATDILMVILLLLLMADRHTGNTVHEWLGVTAAGAFLLHTWLNRSWCKTLAKGRYDFARAVRIVLNILLLLAVTGTLASAVPISRTVFPFMGLGEELASRAVHVCCAHWCFLLAAAHLGMYGKRFGATLGRHVHFPRPHWWERVSPALHVALAAYGAYVFLSRELICLLTMNSAFMLWNGDEHVAFFLLDYGALFFLCAWAAWMLSRLVCGKGKQQMPLLVKKQRRPEKRSHSFSSGRRFRHGSPLSETRREKVEIAASPAPAAESRTHFMIQPRAE